MIDMEPEISITRRPDSEHQTTYLCKVKGTNLIFVSIRTFRSDDLYTITNNQRWMTTYFLIPRNGQWIIEQVLLKTNKFAICESGLTFRKKIKNSLIHTKKQIQLIFKTKSAFVYFFYSRWGWLRSIIYIYIYIVESIMIRKMLRISLNVK